jgi:hypothetical protein
LVAEIGRWLLEGHKGSEQQTVNSQWNYPQITQITQNGKEEIVEGKKKAVGWSRNRKPKTTTDH